MVNYFFNCCLIEILNLEGHLENTLGAAQSTRDQLEIFRMYIWALGVRMISIFRK